MDKIYLTKRYIKKPGKAIAVFFFFFLLVEGLRWSFDPEKKLKGATEFAGPLEYVYIVLRGGIIPELATLIIVLFLIDFAHTLLKIHTVPFSWSAILRYELTFLPVMALAFLFFNPITQSVRYLLVNFPVYDFSYYWDNNIIGTYSLRLYIVYLTPVLFFGYIFINLSLLHDFARDVKIWKYRNTISG